MFIGIISDTHGNYDSVEKAISIAPKMDMWLHLGDCTPDAEYLESLVSVPVFGVAGNCDWPMKSTCYERVVEAVGHKIFMTHGHNYGVRYTQEYVMEAAESQGADIALYGHTHIVDYRIGPPLLLNPGSAARPRDDNRGSFIVMELKAQAEPKITIIRLK